MLLAGGAWLDFYLDRSRFTALQTPLFKIVSFILGIVVLKLSFHAATVGERALAKYRRVGDIPRGQTNRLVTEDIYACTRHPMLFGQVLLPLALALLIGSLLHLSHRSGRRDDYLAFLMIMFDEIETWMKFGKEYKEYRKKTPVFPRDIRYYIRLFIDF